MGLKINIPDWTPVAKGRARTGQGRHYTPARTRAAEQVIRLAAIQAIREQGWQMPDPGVPLQLDVAFCFPIPKATRKADVPRMAGAPRASKPDLDNLIKILDALNGVVWPDDAQVCRISAVKRYDYKPGCVITVEKIIGCEPKDK